jgi:hypothetical protein
MSRKFQFVEELQLSINKRAVSQEKFQNFIIQLLIFSHTSKTGDNFLEFLFIVYNKICNFRVWYTFFLNFCFPLFNFLNCSNSALLRVSEHFNLSCHLILLKMGNSVQVAQILFSKFWLSQKVFNLFFVHSCFEAVILFIRE